MLLSQCERAEPALETEILHSLLTDAGENRTTTDSPVDSYSPLASPLCLSNFSDVSPLEVRLFQYYVDNLSTRLTNVDGFWNPLRVLVLPRMFSSPALFHAVCAGASLHMARFTSGIVEYYDQQARFYYVQALSALNDMIPALNWEQGTESSSMQHVDEIVLLTSIFLCKYEIIKDGMATWRCHLDGVETLFSSLASKYKGSRNDTIDYARSL